jgi:hypothetical protein
VKLKLAGNQLVVQDYFTPCNEKLLDRTCTGNGEACDLDLGSAGPLLVPGAGRLVGGGKDGFIYVVDTQTMGKHHAPMPFAMTCPNPNALQTVVGGSYDAPGGHKGPGVIGNIHGSHVYWKGPVTERIFVWGENDRLRAYTWKNGELKTPAQTSLYEIPPGMPGGMLSVSANGQQAGSAIVWALVTLRGDANRQRGVRAQLLAFDASNIKLDIWHSEPGHGPGIGPDSVGLYAKFAAPTVVGGKVFVATYGDHENPQGETEYGGDAEPPPGSYPHNYYLAVYGLKP